MKEGIERIFMSPKGEVMSTLENEISQERLRLHNAASSDDFLSVESMSVVITRFWMKGWCVMLGLPYGQPFVIPTALE